MNEPLKVILDVDTGSDDAIALMLALRSPALQVEAVCTVWGNLDVTSTTKNTIAVLEKMGQGHIPVYQGCARPMMKDREPDRDTEERYEKVYKDGRELRIHYPTLPGMEEPKASPQPTHAVRFYWEYLSQAKEPVTLIAVGPQTNLGYVFRIAPHLSKKVKKLIVMGGGVEITNASRTGEANLWHDPEAFETILQAGVPVLLVPLDATQSAPLNEADCDALEALGTAAGSITAQLARERIEYESTLFAPVAKDDRKWTPIHDALAVYAAIDSSVLTDVKAQHIQMGMRGQSDGELLVDYKAMPDPPNAEVAYRADKEKFLAHLLASFAPEKGETT